VKGKIKLLPVVLGAVSILGLPPLLMLSLAPEPSIPAVQPANAFQAVVAERSALEPFYLEWQKSYLRAGGDGNVMITVGWTEGLSTEASSARGQVDLDLIEGMVRAKVRGLEGPADLWLVDNQDAPGMTVEPEPGDRMFRIGRLANGREIKARLGRDFFRGFELDLLVVSPAGRTPDQSRTLIGTRSYFERLYTTTRVQAERSRETARLPGLLSPAGLGSLFGSRPAEANSGVLIAHGLISQTVGQGGDLFFRGTFSGNGRTCATCHRVNNNQGLDLDFIQTLSPFDKLFVAELPAFLGGVPGLERPDLMRDHALILENADGFGPPSPTVRFTMRGVPHSLSMATSMLAPADGRAPVQRTGWSGDGAPSTGALRLFPVGAVTQHFPKRLNRVSGTDFVLPTDAQLDRMEAFSLASGRLNELNLANVTLSNSGAQAGKIRFVAADARCNGCHANAGANIATGQNFNFDTGVEKAPDPSQTTEVHPRDGGFGTANRDCDGNGSLDCFGDGTFNTTPLIEAADTEPFFHNNSAPTIEDAVAFYTTPAFAQSPAGGGTAVPLTATDVANIGKFLRVINASFNNALSIKRNSAALALENSASTDPNKRNTVNMLLSLSNAEALDAVEVLDEKGLHSDAVFFLISAITKNISATFETSTATRKSLIQSALADLNFAKTRYGSGLSFTLGEGNLMF
jgi:cytochrome c peroxidase